MKKVSKVLIGLVSLASFSSAFGDDLLQKLNDLNVPSDRVTPLISSEDLYSVNSRYSSLINRHELTFEGANNFNPDSHLKNETVSASYIYHLNSKWSFEYRYTEYQNELSAAGKKLFDDKKLLPDTDYALKSSEFLASYNTFYGKMRITEKQIVYFDQYITLGRGTIALASGETDLTSLDLGFAFWLGKSFSLRTGLRNEFYTQNRLSGSRDVQHSFGYLELGYLFGEGTRI